MARVLAISNQKGGVGKTTTAINLSAALALTGRRVLLVDLDPQGNASSGLGHPRADTRQGTYHWVMGFAGLDAVRVSGGVEGLDLVPCTREMVGLEVELLEEDHPQRRLRRVLSPERAAWDFVVLDCPPSLGLVTVSALTAADAVMVPLQAEYYAMEGLGALLETIAAVRRSLNPDLEREGIVVTMTDTRNNLCREVERQAREHFGEGVYRTTIPRNVRLGEAPSFGRPILEYDPRSRGAQAYLALAGELLVRQERAAARVAS